MAFWLRFFSEVLLGLAGVDGKTVVSRIEAKGELNSSSSSSLVLDFLSTEDPLLLSSDFVPTSPMNAATEATEGG